jgi:hypothetical protein
MTQTTDVDLPRPRLVDVAFALALTAAACTIVFAAMLPFQIDGSVARQAEDAAAQGVSRQALHDLITEFVVTEVILATLFVAALVWAAFRVRAGRRRFRVLLIVLTVLALVPANGQALLVTALLVAADVLLFRKPSSAWLRSREGARALARARKRI